MTQPLGPVSDQDVWEITDNLARNADTVARLRASEQAALAEVVLKQKQLDEAMTHSITALDEVVDAFRRRTEEVDKLRAEVERLRAVLNQLIPPLKLWVESYDNPFTGSDDAVLRDGLYRVWMSVREEALSGQ